MFDRFRLLTMVMLFVILVRSARSGESTFRFVPYPKQVELRGGTFPLAKKLLLEVPADEADVLGPMIGRELARAGLPMPETRPARDWPSLEWRCFQNDMTRGPSTTLETLRRPVDLGSSLKMNLFTYYMEYQYAFKKHPIIGSKDGSLQPEDLAALVEYARRRHVDILGNQQAFSHFSRILKHQWYAALREAPHSLTPVNAGTYQILDDLYSEVCPLFPFAMFNVCCDETEELGDGPSKKLADEIGVGGVYVRHIRRVYDLIKNKYGKRR